MCVSMCPQFYQAGRMHFTALFMCERAIAALRDQALKFVPPRIEGKRNAAAEIGGIQKQSRRDLQLPEHWPRIQVDIFEPVVERQYRGVTWNCFTGGACGREFPVVCRNCALAPAIPRGGLGRLPA